MLPRHSANENHKAQVRDPTVMHHRNEPMIPALEDYALPKTSDDFGSVEIPTIEMSR